MSDGPKETVARQETSPPGLANAKLPAAPKLDKKMSTGPQAHTRFSHCMLDEDTSYSSQPSCGQVAAVAPSEVPLTELPENDPETSAVNVAIDPVRSSRMGRKSDKQGFKHALTRKSRFYYMASDSLAVQGLKDWSADQWASAFERNPKAAMKFCTEFIGGEEHEFDEPSQRQKAARLVKARMDDSLEGGQWEMVIRFQNFCAQMEAGRGKHTDYYMEQPLIWNYMFDRDFPLGVEEQLLSEPWPFAVEHSGVRQVGHAPNSTVTVLVYFAMLAVIVMGLFMLLRLMVREQLWNLVEGTQQDHRDAARATLLTNERTKDRGTVASILTSLSFSLMVNALLDKYGRIDPSTSTVFIGMTLGGTFGFILDNQLGSDEGFREYLWSPGEGMRYALGALASARYGRYLITIIFDMFFTVILFKTLYSKLVRMAGFSTHGREWVANGMVSCFIGIITYQVYTNMTRFEWAYPSGVEDVKNQWISGSTMILNVVIMNMVYLVTETRVKVGEAGINDPPVKVVVTLATYLGLFLLQSQGYVDPSKAPDTSGWPLPRGCVRDPITGELVAPAGSQVPCLAVSNIDDYDVPLPGVCATKKQWRQGAAVFFGIAVFCLAFVIFATSKQSLSGLKAVFCKGARPVSEPSQGDRLAGKVCLFLLFMCLTGLIMLFFSVVPFYSAGRERRLNNTLGEDWKTPCEADTFNKTALYLLGIA